MRLPLRTWLAPLLAASAAIALAAATSPPWPSVYAQSSTEFILPAQGCPMAHCDARMSGNVDMSPPVDSSTQVVFADPLPEGARGGLGCSSNGTVVACAFHNILSPSMVVYDGDGSRLFTSGKLLNRSAWTSAPIVDTFGGVIAADSRTLVRFAADGTVLWRRSTVGGPAFSPVVTASGAVILATSGGPISAYSVRTGALLGTITIASPHAGVYGTRNTPAVNGDRVYVSLALDGDGLRVGRLAAIDVDASGTGIPLNVRWHVDFVGPSGATPLFVNDMVFFDGFGGKAGVFGGRRLFAVRDLGDSAKLVWQAAMPGRVLAAPTEDPRGGIWVFAAGDRHLSRLDVLTGALIERLDVDALVDGQGTQVPSSVMSIARTPDDGTIMLLGTVSLLAESYVIALDLDNSRLLWRVKVPGWSERNFVTSQFPIVLNSRGLPRVVFPGTQGGAFFVGVP
jgi:outer membrane protein assembly factor BamB